MRKFTIIVSAFALVVAAAWFYLAVHSSSSDVPRAMTTSSDGKTVQELYSWTKDVGQKRVMEILLRRSKGQPWRATKLDYPDTEMVWRYTQPDLDLHASYTRDDKAHDSIYYFLTVGL